MLFHLSVFDQYIRGMDPLEIADKLLHAFAILILLFTICKRKSCLGISAKSQLLYAAVFITRYLVYVLPPRFSLRDDLSPISRVLQFLSNYFDYLYWGRDTFLSFFFIVASCVILYLIYVRFKDTNDSQVDYCRIDYFLVPCVLLSLCFHFLRSHPFPTEFEILWAFSLYLESVAILPQLLLTLRTNKTDSYIFGYLLILGSFSIYRIIYWMYEYYVYPWMRYEIEDFINLSTGIVQALVYITFFSFYLTRAHEVPYKVSNI